MRTNIDFRKDVLFIKIIGLFVSSRVKKFESEVIPIILSLKTNKLVINMRDVTLIDKEGINSIIKISDIVNRFNGKVVLCELNDYLKINFKHSDIFDYCYKTKNENTTSWVFNA